MGKQIINILPEGSAVLNPENKPFCLDPKSKTGEPLPIYFNAAVPAEIELIRIDLETNKEEIIKIPSRDVNKIARSIRDQGPDPSDVQWQYYVKRPGVYRLGKVLDEYKLEVQRRTKDTYVVICPQANFRAVESRYRCLRDLSDLSLEVHGTPPLKITYSLTMGKHYESRNFQSLQPDEFVSPLVAGSGSSALTFEDDFSWVQRRKVVVGLNESLTDAGEWEYSVDLVQDAFGNTVNYTKLGEDADPASLKGLSQKFIVTHRPRISMSKCDLRTPLRVAKGQSTSLPIKFDFTGPSRDDSHEITWRFSPIDSLTTSGDHGDQVTIVTHNVKQQPELPMVSQPGLYTLNSVSSGSCEGEVDEPSSCLLLNPLEPHLSLRSEDIPDKCAGNSIGLRVDFDLVGTPPFIIVYDIFSEGRPDRKKAHVDGLRSQLELIPNQAGQHKYVFRSISDSVYKDIPLSGRDKVLEQVVKPAASAKLSHSTNVINACLDDHVEVDVRLNGDPPFNLEWETIHDGKRKTERASNLEDTTFKIKTPSLTKGGEYILALSSVQDKRGCRSFLKDQIKILVRRQRPRAGFLQIEQKYSKMAVEGKNLSLPLRLQGEGPWTVRYRNLNESGSPRIHQANTANDHIVVKSRGIYEIVDVTDKCPGTVDKPASRFQVDWYPRPELSFVQSESITGGKNDRDAFVKQNVCEGDIDGFELNFQGKVAAPYSLRMHTTLFLTFVSGSAPYYVSYEVLHKPLQGPGSKPKKDSLNSASSKAAISMDTGKPGDYTYRFVGLEDSLYNGDKTFRPLELKQRVNAKPSAVFSKPGQAFKYCMQEQEHEDNIPITLSGVAPFYVEVEIKHQSGSPPETYRISSINSNSYAMPIPREHLRLGAQQLRIRRVRDAKGCQQKYEVSAPSIQIQLFDSPSIYALESRDDFCVGDRIAYTLSGTPPFDIIYEFNGERKARSHTTNFRRVAEKPGDFTITSIADKASECRAAMNLRKTIHPLPSVQISRGKQSRVDIHEGNEVDILFEFWGTPPFEFTYTRSSNARKGQRSVVLETRHDTSYEHSKIIKASQEGTYEVVAIKDKFCAFSTQQVAEKRDGR